MNDSRVKAAWIAVIGAIIVALIYVLSPKILNVSIGSPTTIAPPAASTPYTPQAPLNGTSQEIIVPTGSSQQILAGDCVDTWQLENIHATYDIVFQKPSWVRVKITEDGSVDGQATIYRNSGCYSS